MPISLYWLKFCYLDTEYIRHDLKTRTSVIDRFAADNITLFSIQYAIFKYNTLWGRINPKLTVLTQKSKKNEFDLLNKFLPTWLRFFGNPTKKKRLIPLGYVIQADLQIIANKFAQYQSKFLENDPDLPLNIFNPLHVLQVSRYFDLVHSAQLYSGHLDVKLRNMTKNEHLDGNETKNIILKLLNISTRNEDRKELSSFFQRYVLEEYHATLKLIRTISSRLNPRKKSKINKKNIKKKLYQS